MLAVAHSRRSMYAIGADAEERHGAAVNAEMRRGAKRGAAAKNSSRHLATKPSATRCSVVSSITVLMALASPSTSSLTP